MSSGRSKVEMWVKVRSLPWRILEMPSTTRTVDDAARALGVTRDYIVKTLIVICGDDVLAVIVPGDRRLDMLKLGSALKREDCRLAKPVDVERLTGYPAGGVPPVALPEGVRVVIDASLLSKDVVYGGGGGENALLEFSPRELASLGSILFLDVSSSSYL